MACSIVKEDLIKQINRALVGLSAEFDVDISDGKRLTTKTLGDKIFQIEDELKKLEAVYGVNSIYVIDEGLAGDLFLNISIDVDKLAVDVEKNINGETTEREQSNYDKASYFKLKVSALKNHFDRNPNNLNDYLITAQLAIEKIINIKQLKEVLKDAISDRAVLSELAEIKKQLNIEITNPDFDAKLNAFVLYLGEVNTLSTQVFEIAQELVDQKDPHAFLKLNQLNALVRGHYPIIAELHQSLTKPGINNDLTRSLDHTLKMMDLLENRTIDSASVHLEHLFTDLNTEPVNEMRKKAKEEIDRLTTFKASTTSQAIKDKVDVQIQAVEKRLAENAPTKSLIRRVLNGELGDVSMWSTWFRSAITVPDVIVTSLMENYSRALTRVRDKMIGVKNEFQTAKDAYLKAKDLSDPVNPENFYAKFTTIRTESYYDYDAGLVKNDKKSRQLLTEIHVDFYKDRSKFEMELKSSGIAIKKAENDWKDGIGTEDAYKEAIKKHDDIRLAFKAWRRENLMRKESDAFYAPDREYLEKFIYQDSDGTFKLSDTKVDGSLYLSDVYKQYNERISDIDRILRRQPDNQELIKEKMELIGLKSNLRSPLKWKEGTIEYAMAEVFLKYYSKKKLMTKTEVSEERYKQFFRAQATKRKQLAEGKINREEFDAWIKYNTTRKFSQEYFDASNKLTERMDVLRKKIVAETGSNPETAKYKQKWDEMNAAVAKYRDHMGIIDGTLVEEADVELIRNLQLEIEELSELNVTIEGLSAEQKAEKKRLTFEKQEKTNARNFLWERLIPLSKEIAKNAKAGITNVALKQEKKTLSDDIKRIDESIEALNEKKKAIDDSLKLSDSIKRKIAEYKELQEQKAKLSVAATTDYYKAEFDKHLDAYISERYNETPDSFSYYDGVRRTTITFNPDDNSYYTDKGVLVEDVYLFFRESMKESFKRESEWFKKNHIEKDLWTEVKYFDSKGGIRTKYELVPTMVAIHIWQDFTPSDPDQILTNEPSYAWSQYVIKDSYVDSETNQVISLVNASYEEDKQGNPLPKKDKYVNEEYFRNTEDWNDADRTFVEFLRKKYHSFQETYSPNQRMGDVIPSIEQDLGIFEHNADSRNVGSTWEKFKRKWVTTEQDKDNEMGDTSGNIAQFQRVYFSGDIPVDQVSTNIFSSILKYGHAATQYSEIAEDVLPAFEATEKVLVNTPIKSSKKDALLNKIIKTLPDSVASQLGVQRLLNQPGSTNNRLRMVQELKAMLVYGESIVPTEVGSVRIDKVFNNLLGFKSKTVLASAPFAPVAIAREMGNMGGALVQQAIKTGAKKSRIHLDTKEWLKSYNEITTKYSKDMLSDWGKSGNKSMFGQLTELFGVFHENMLNVTGEEIKEASAVRKASDNVFFFLKNSVEITLASSIFLTLAKTHYIKENVNGELRNILDADGKPISVMNAFHLVNGKLEKKYENWDENDFFRFKNKFNKLNRDTNGAYQTSEKSLLQRHWIGISLFWMKKWLIPIAENMYGERRFSYEEGRDIEGYWRVGVPAIIGAIRTLAKDPRNYNIIHETLTIEQQESVKQIMIQLSLLAIVWSIIALGFGYDDDDKDRFKKMKERDARLNWILYGFLRAQTEIEGLVVPYGLDEIRRIKNGGLGQFLPLYDETLKLYDDINLIGEGPVFKEYKNNTENYDKGDIKFFVDLQKLIGITESKKATIFDGESNAPIGAVKGLEFSKKK
jgi:hypothetical protein